MKKQFGCFRNGVIIYLSLLVTGLSSTNVFVAANGSDTNVGSLEAPFATIQHAVDQLTPGMTCYIRGGNYREAVDLSGVAGDDGNPVSIVAYNGEKVVLDGTVEITPLWQLDEGNVYKADVAQEVTQLFMDRKLMTLARHPNALAFSEDIWRNSLLGQDPGSSNGTAIDAALVNLGVSFNDCVAVMTLGSHITYARLVENHAAGSDRFNFETVTPYITRHGYFFEGGLNNADRILLDSAQEWSYDESTGTLYFMNEDGSDPTGSEFTIKDKVYSLVGDATTKNVIVDGIDFFATTYYFESSDNITIQNCDSTYYVSSRRSLGDVVRPLTAFFEGTSEDFCENIRIYNCKFEQADGAGLWADRVENMLVENNLFKNIDYACVSPDRGDPDVSFTQTQAAVVIREAQDLVYRRNTLITAGSGQGIITTLSNPHEGRPTTYELNFHTDCSRREQDGAAFQTPLEEIVGCVARNNWLIDNWQRDFRWDGNNRPLRGVYANYFRNVAMSNRVKNVAVVDGQHLKGDYHENYNNTSIYNWSQLGVSVASGGNANTITKNNAADLFDDNPIPGITSHNLNSADVPTSTRLILRDPDNHDFRPRLGSLDANGDEYLIDQGVPVVATVEHLPSFGNIENVNVIKTIDVTEGYVGSAPDIGAYEYGASYYWIAGRQDEQAAMPIPREDGEFVVLDSDLMYLIGLNGVSANVYFGSSADSLKYLTSKAATENIVHLPSFVELEGNTTYYWRVDTVLADGSVIEGKIWSFQTLIDRESPDMINRTINGGVVGTSWSQVSEGSWVYDNGDTSFSRRALLYSEDTYRSPAGLKLTIGYTTGSIDSDLAHNFSFGLISADDTNVANYGGNNPFRSQTDVYSLGVHVIGHGTSQGLNFTNNSEVTTLDTAGTNVQFGEDDAFEQNDSNVVEITVLPSGHWSYSINGILEASGTFAELGVENFDLTKNYHIAVFAQDDNGRGKRIQHLSIEPFGYKRWVKENLGEDGLGGTGRDTDGISDLLEYVLNGDPLANDVTILPILVEEDGNHVFKYNRSAISALDTSQVIQYSNDLFDWRDGEALTGANIPNNVKIEPGEDGVEEVQVTIPPGQEVGGKLFARLKVLLE